MRILKSVFFVMRDACAVGALVQFSVLGFLLLWNYFHTLDLSGPREQVIWLSEYVWKVLVEVVRPLTWLLLQSIVPFIPAVLYVRRYGGKGVVKIPTRRLAGKQVELPYYEPERFQTGSDYIAAQPSECQFRLIGQTLEGDLVNAGQGFFNESGHVLTAAHNLHGFDKIFLRGKVGQIEYPPDSWTVVEGDLAVSNMTRTVASSIGLAPGHLVEEGPAKNSGLYCKVTGFASSALGLLMDNKSFGFVTFKGSTAKGYSGAPYFAGKYVYGMHLGGSRENLGYSAGYLSMILRSFTESSEDFLFKQMLRYTDYDYMQSPFDPEEYRLRINGRYHLVDSDTLKKLLDRKTARVTYEPESCTAGPEEIEVTPTPLVSGNGKAPVANATGAHGKSASVLGSVLKKRPLPPAETGSSIASRKATAGLVETRARRNVALQSISSFSKTLRKINSTIRPKFSNKRLQQQSTVSELGKLRLIAAKMQEVSSMLDSMELLKE